MATTAPLNNLSDEQKYALVAKYMPCDKCECKGWIDQIEVCSCGHSLMSHVDQKQEFEQQVHLALEIDLVLKEKGEGHPDFILLKEELLKQKDLKRSRDSFHDEKHLTAKKSKSIDHDTLSESLDEWLQPEDVALPDVSLNRLCTPLQPEDVALPDASLNRPCTPLQPEDVALPDVSLNRPCTPLQPEDIALPDASLNRPCTPLQPRAADGLPCIDLPPNDDVVERQASPQEKAQPTEWTEPEDWKYMEEKKKGGLEGLRAVSSVENGGDLCRPSAPAHLKQEIEDIYPSGHSAMSSEKADSSPESVVQDVYRASAYFLDPKLQDYLPKERKESAAMKEEREGQIRAQVVLNDGQRESMILLTGLKNVFQKQLPEMPKDYIARLVYDRNHRSIALIRNPNKVIGGICYRPFDLQEFAEIVFCAIASTEQVKGYGSFIMNHLKDYVGYHTDLKHFLTYADNFAMGYFRKQGFTTEITLDKRKWVGFIKDYEGGTIMQCSMVPKVKYLELHEILSVQRNAILKKMEEKTDHPTFPGIHIPPGQTIDPHTVPGISDSGWTSEMDVISNIPRHAPHYHEMLFLVEEMQNYTHAWPFLEPVKVEDVADYYDIIKEPMDLTTLEENVKADAYLTLEEFVKDTSKIFINCKTYNAQDTEYSKCAAKLEKFFNDKLKSLNLKQPS